MALLGRKPKGNGVTQPSSEFEEKVRMSVGYNPGAEDVYSLVDQHGKVLLSSNRRRDLVAIMESGVPPARKSRAKGD